MALVLKISAASEQKEFHGTMREKSAINTADLEIAVSAIGRSYGNGPGNMRSGMQQPGSRGLISITLKDENGANLITIMNKGAASANLLLGVDAANPGVEEATEGSNGVKYNIGAVATGTLEFFLTGKRSDNSNDHVDMTDDDFSKINRGVEGNATALYVFSWEVVDE